MSARDSSPPRAAPQILAGTALILALLALCAAAGAIFLVLQTNQATPWPATQSEVAQLRHALAAVQTRLAVLERPRPDDGRKAALTRAQGAIALLGARVAKLEATPDPAAIAQLADLQLRLAALQADQTRLAARIVHLESLDPTTTLRRAAAELALANLARADADGPFAAELKTFAALMPNTPEVAALAPLAAQGAPTQIALAARFPDVAARALAAEKSAQAKGWAGKLWANIANAVVIRRIGDAKGADSEAVLARAGARLKGGDLAAALAEMQTLRGAARAASQDWIVQAKARLAIARATAALASRMAKLLTAP